jgi:hypothetical protein
MSQHVPDNPYPDERETTVYHIGRGVSVLIILCFALLVVVPVAVDHVLRFSHSENGVAHAKRQAFFFEVLNPPAFDPETPRPEDKRIVHHLRWLERGLDRAGYATTLRQNVQEQITGQFAEGNRKVFIGFEGWLFYRPDIQALTGYGPLKPEPFSVMKDPDLAQQPAAGECIREFAAQLKERGIQLVFVPLPLKPMVYPEMIDPNATEEWLTHPDAAEFYDTLRKDGVDVLDLTPDLAKLRTMRKHVHFLVANSNNREIARQSEEALKERKDAFLMHDTHWTTDAMRFAAEKIAGHVKEKYATSMRPTARTITSVDGADRKSLGDLVKLLDLRGPEALFEPEKQFVHLVTDGTEDTHSPIALLGDSFVNVYDDPSLGFENPVKPSEHIRAGFAQHLSLLLNQPLDVIAMNGRGATGVRREFGKRYDDEVREKKLLIWVIAARDVLLSRHAAKEANIEWGFVQFNPKRSPDALEVATTKPGVSAQVVIEATLKEKSRNQEVVGTPYRDALHTATYEVTRVAEGNLDTKEVSTVQWTFKDKVMQPTAGFQVGKKYRLTLVPWESKSELKGLNLQEDVLALGVDQWFVEKAEEMR